MKTVRHILIAMIVAAGMSACEDPVPEVYVPRYAVEAFLFVGEPITGVKLLRTQEVNDTFALGAAFIRTADVDILTDGDTLQLVFRNTEGGGEYWYPDSLYTVQPNSTYRLRIRLAEGGVITGRTVTPSSIAFIREVPDTLQYPKDTINLTVDQALRISWTPAPGIGEYILRVKALDTLGYGQYLTPPTEEQNRRIYRFWEEDAPKYNDVTRWGFVPATDIPGSWNAFKWFGMQQLTVFAPDANFLEWFKQMKFGGASPTYNSLLGSVEGAEAIGVFASASTAIDTTFVLKNQP